MARELRSTRSHVAADEAQVIMRRPVLRRRNKKSPAPPAPAIQHAHPVSSILVIQPVPVVQPQVDVVSQLLPNWIATQQLLLQRAENQVTHGSSPNFSFRSSSSSSRACPWRISPSSPQMLKIFQLHDIMPVCSKSQQFSSQRQVDALMRREKGKASSATTCLSLRLPYPASGPKPYPVGYTVQNLTNARLVSSIQWILLPKMLNYASESSQSRLQITHTPGISR